MKKYTMAIIAIAIILGGVFYFLSNKKSAETPTVAKSTEIQSGYHLDFASDFSSIIPGKPSTVTFSVKDGQGNILKDFQIDHTKLLHFIVIRKDLQEFQHIHPDLNQTTGEFSIAITFPTAGPYRLFADFVPAGTPMESDGMAAGTVAYQDISIGDATTYKVQPATLDTQTTKSFNGYDITYRFPQIITAGTPTKFSIHIAKSGQPVSDLEDYLGAVAHTIILGENSLSYMHIHAVDRNGRMASSMGSMPGMEMGDSVKGPDIDFVATFTQSGNYKLFTQFQEKGNLTTADYMVSVR